MTARDDFPDPVKRTLAERVGRVCSNPECYAPTSGPQADPAKAVNMGVAAHITAAALGGPRYDSTLTEEQRRDHRNGIWLCQNCAKFVDNDPVRYTEELLRVWKTAEDRARHRIGKPDASFEAGRAIAEQSRARQMHAMAVSLLRRVCGHLYKSNNLPVLLLGTYTTRSFWKLVEDLGRTDQRGSFTPHTQPSQFHQDDQPALKAAEEMLRSYLVSVQNSPGFDEIRAQYELPDPDEVRALLPDADR